jgi:GT2 family glycosyltransferase/glycosyltransferase involved in cell wall biosynthesis
MNRQLPVKPKRSLPLRFLHMLWRKRHPAVAALHSAGTLAARAYDKFPLPRRVKDITTELTFQTIEHLIVQSTPYQDWLEQRSGFSRLHHLFDAEQPEATPPVSAAPSEAQWAQLATRRREPEDTTPEVAVVIPVYSGYGETLNCLYRVLSCHNDTPFQITVINDASPDAALTETLNELRRKLPFELLANKSNQGFVRTANRGLRRHAGQHVILLNADTEVCDHWVDRLMRALLSADDIASVTPLSNNAELCSYPQMFHPNPEPLELSAEELNLLLPQVHDGSYPELPTAVGFCMAMRREAIQQTGRFDEKHFGKGYGEENDWCLRSAAQGWKHVLAPDTYVTHIGSVSFAGARQRQLRRSLRRLNARHPEYRATVRNFRRTDPLLQARRRIDMARMLRMGAQENWLMISHNAGGGTERHVHEMCSWLKEEGVSCYRLSPGARASEVKLWHPDCPQVSNLTFHLQHEQEAFFAALQQLNISHLHLHHLHGFSPYMHLLIPQMAEVLHADYDVTIHDYYLACPSINLPPDIAALGRLPTIEESQDYAAHHPTPAGRMPLRIWRRQHDLLLRGARSIFVPDQSVADAMHAFFPDITTQLRPHPEPRCDAPDLFRPHQPGEPLNIAVIGTLARHKGAEIIAACAKEALQQKQPLQFHVFGACDHPALRKNKLVTLHGAYRDDGIYALLQRQGCHAAFIPSVWPETWSYTLSIALNSGLHPVCFDLGAPAHRLRETGRGTILPVSMIAAPAAINRELLALDIAQRPAKIPAGAHYDSFLRDYYARDVYASKVAASS